MYPKKIIMKEKFVFAILMSLFIANKISAQIPSMVKDIYPGSNFSNPNTIITGIPFNNGYLFTASDGTNGSELWFSDGSTAGTNMVKDIYPGNSTSFPASYFSFNSKIYFRASDTNGNELWQTDGTNGGTALVKDIWPGIGSSLPLQFTVAPNCFYFVANDGVSGQELWKSDGTTLGTSLIKDINPGSGSSNITILQIVGNNLFFSADNGINGKELWKSDGTLAGTMLVKDMNVGPGATTFVGSGISYNNKLFFLANDGSGLKFWESDGSVPGTFGNNSIPNISSNIIDFNNNLYFFIKNTISNKDSLTLIKLSASVNTFSVIKTFTVANVISSLLSITLQQNNNKFIFYACRGVGSTYVYSTGISDGTTLGTILTHTAQNVLYSISKIDLPFINNNWMLTLYKSPPGNTNFDLFNIDYNTGATNLVKNINPSTNLCNGFSNYCFNNAVLNNKVYFAANAGSTGLEFWESDGTLTGTNLLLDIFPGSNSGLVGTSIDDGNFTPIISGNNVFFLCK